MSIESTEFSGDTSLLLDWMLETGIWNGKPISWFEADDALPEINAGILRRLFEAPPEEFDRLAAQFAWIGSQDANRALLAKDIQSLNSASPQLVGLGKSVSKFWEKHKVAIIVGIVVVAVVTTVVVVAVTTGGTGAAGAAAAGASALGALPQNNPPSQNPPANKERPPGSIVYKDKLVFEEKGIVVEDKQISYNEINRSLSYPPINPYTPPTLKEHYGLQDRPKEPLPSFQEIKPYVPPNIQPQAPLPSTEEKNWFASIFDVFKGKPAEEPAFPKWETSSHFATAGTREPHLKIIGINGMNTSSDQARSHAEYVGGGASGRSIDWIHNASHGEFAGVAESLVLNLQGVSPNTAPLLIEEWTAFHRDNKDRPQAKCLQYCHSQGAIHVRNALEQAPEEIRNRVIVVAIAPADVVPRRLCYNSFNYALPGDLVPCGGLLSARSSDKAIFSETMLQKLKDQEELIMLDPIPDYAGSAHDFQNPAFKHMSTKHLDDYLDKNGEYK